MKTKRGFAHRLHFAHHLHTPTYLENAKNNAGTHSTYRMCACSYPTTNPLSTP